MAKNPHIYTCRRGLDSLLKLNQHQNGREIDFERVLVVGA